MTENSRNDLTIYDGAAANWWYDDIRLVHSSKDLVPGRLGWFDKHVDWNRLTILDLGCAPVGGDMAEALAARGAKVTGIDPAAQAINAARVHAAEAGIEIQYDVGVGEELSYENVTSTLLCAPMCWRMWGTSSKSSLKWRGFANPAASFCSTRSTAIFCRVLRRSPLPKIPCAFCPKARTIRRFSFDPQSCVPD